VVFEQRMYLSLAAVSVLVVVLLDGGIRWVAARLSWSGASARGVFLGSVAVLAGVLAASTIRRNHDFRDPRAIWSDVVAKRPANPRGYTNLAHAYTREGKFEEAESLLRTALELRPYDSEANNSLGVTLERLGRPTEAIPYFRRAVQARSGNTLARDNLGMALLREGKVEEALEQLRIAVATSPQDARARVNLGTALDANDQPREADAEYAESLRLAPDWPRSQANLAWYLLLNDESTPYDLVDALRIARQVCRATGFENPEYLDLLAAGLAASGEYASALETAQKAMRLAEEAGNTDLAKAIAARVELYRQNKSYTKENVVAKQTGTVQ
jgi:Flp pilus assembly protein TadD